MTSTIVGFEVSDLPLLEGTSASGSVSTILGIRKRLSSVRADQGYEFCSKSQLNWEANFRGATRCSCAPLCDTYGQYCNACAVCGR